MTLNVVGNSEGGEELQPLAVKVVLDDTDVMDAPPSPLVATSMLVQEEEMDNTLSKEEARKELLEEFKKSWGSNFKPQNLLKTGKKGATTDEREDYLNILKGIAKKYLIRTQQVL